MKKLCLLLAACMTFLLFAGCGTKPATAAEPDIALDTVMEDILAQVDMPDMMPLTAENLLDYYGLDAAEIADSAVCVNSNGYAKEEIVLLRAVDESRVAGIADKLNLSLEDAAAQMQNYLPDQYAMIQKSAVEHSGTYVWLFVSENNAQMQEIWNSYLHA